MDLNLRVAPDTCAAVQASFDVRQGERCANATPPAGANTRFGKAYQPRNTAATDDAVLDPAQERR
jgi:hypothetical protein